MRRRDASRPSHDGETAHATGRDPRPGRPPGPAPSYDPRYSMGAAVPRLPSPVGELRQDPGYLKRGVKIDRRTIAGPMVAAPGGPTTRVRFEQERASPHISAMARRLTDGCRARQAGCTGAGVGRASVAGRRAGGESTQRACRTRNFGSAPGRLSVARDRSVVRSTDVTVAREARTCGPTDLDDLPEGVSPGCRADSLS